MARIRTIKVQRNSTINDYPIHSVTADKLARSSKVFTSGGYQGDKDLDGNIVVNGDVLTSKTTFSKSHVYGYTVCFLDGKTPTKPEDKNEELTATLETLLTKSRDVSVSENNSGTITDKNENISFYPNPYYRFNLLYNTTNKSDNIFVHNCTLRLSHLDSTMYNGQEIFIIFRTSYGALNIFKDTSFSKATYFGQLATDDSITIKLDEHRHTIISILKLNDWYYVRDLGVGEDTGDTPSSPEPSTGSVSYSIDSCSIYYTIGRLGTLSNGDETQVQPYAVLNPRSSLGSIPNTQTSPLTFPVGLDSASYDWNYVYKITISPTGQSFSKTLGTSDFTGFAINSFGTADGSVVAVGDTSNIDTLIDSTSVSVSIADGSSKSVYVVVSKTVTLGNITSILAEGLSQSETKQKTGAKLVGSICGTPAEKTVSYYYTAKSGSTGGGEEPKEGDYNMSCDNIIWCSRALGSVGKHANHEVGTMWKSIQGSPVDNETIYLMDNSFTTASSIDLMIPLNIRLAPAGTQISPTFNASNITLSQFTINGQNIVPDNKNGSLVLLSDNTIAAAVEDVYKDGNGAFKTSVSSDLKFDTILYVYFARVFEYEKFKDAITIRGSSYPYEVKCLVEVTYTTDEKSTIPTEFKAWISDKTMSEF